MELKEIRELLRLLERHDIADFTLERGDQKIRVRRGTEQAKAAPPVRPAAGGESAQERPIAAPAAAGAHAPREVTAGENQFIVTSPMVGTFYRSPSPDAAAYAEVGTVVSKGKVLAIVEAMKLMNEIECEVSGKVAAVLVENAQPVEYGAPLFIIDLA
jgi:acetyl-CoA carboxylase biotin carboxyl carrier protein